MFLDCFIFVVHKKSMSFIRLVNENNEVEKFKINKCYPV